MPDADADARRETRARPATLGDTGPASPPF